MSRKLVVLPEAIQESRDAYAWYRAQDPETAEPFQREVERAIEAVFDAPLRWPVFDNETRAFSWE